MSESVVRAVGGPWEPEVTHCCVCGGPLLLRGRPLTARPRVWFLGRQGFPDDLAYDHDGGCAAAAVPAGVLIGMSREQALAEAARRSASPGDGDGGTRDGGTGDGNAGGGGG
ncbi:hypothetical protein [Streptomyces radiopugnans]|uniref:Uncharacterized protein n=1 Tax=Streptomyces radiopugnans TaxID=403935 RepID=A0A1H9BLG3_9ACTN|nr:hypothetical protein [Streptomyces radiopugnans]SEP89786.1 hypothetical protein SAMN05216481_102461 [Streptomyces radiopugnans]